MFFLDIVTHYRRGALNRAINEKLAEVAKACRATNKVGEIVVTLKVKPSKTGGNEYTFDGSVKAKVPQTAIPEAIFFIDEKGNISRDDPAQTKMFDDDERPGVTSLDRQRVEAMHGAMTGNMTNPMAAG